jgi:glycosyltransferase involved in cell wall biosynthesis
VRVLVYPHDLGMGGSQLNAIEIAATIAQDGHPTVIFGRPGPLQDRIAELGLEFVEAPEPSLRPSRRVVRRLQQLIAERDIDVVHGYEWPPALECLLAARSRPAVRSVATVLSMSVAPFIPHELPLLVGTEQIAHVERRAGRSCVGVIEPPVDLSVNDPRLDVGAGRFRSDWGLAADAFLVVCVTRLAHELKLEGLLSAIDGVARLAGPRPTLVIVGDGPAQATVSARAAEVNARLGRQAIVLTGQLADPRPAYAAADLVLGMGSSALRGMSFEKPLVVQGEAGFFKLVTSESLPEFFWTGWYGIGSDPTAGAADFAAIVSRLMADAELGLELGALGRSVVQRRFSVEVAAAAQLDFYRSVLASPPVGRLRRMADEGVSAGRFADYRVRRKLLKLAGRAPRDDFGSQPAARTEAARGCGFPLGTQGRQLGDRDLVVYLAGGSWDAVAGTDRHLMTALAARVPVLWVDPPTSPVDALRGRRAPAAGLAEVAPGLRRLHTSGPPGVSRPVLRELADRMRLRQARAAAAHAGGSVAAVICAAPEPLLAGWPGKRVYFATDDFVAGAALLGLDEHYLSRARRQNLRQADLVLAVSDSLAQTLALDSDVPVEVLANGCFPELYAGIESVEPAGDVRLPAPIAGLVGQLNDRIDLTLLEAVAAEGISLLLVGPRSERAAESRGRIDALLERPNVQWVGRQSLERLPAYLAAIDVGLTPYTDTAFNRSSFPLKTLEYLAAGRPVVSTDLPAVRWLNTELIDASSDPEKFLHLLRIRLAETRTDEAVAARQAYARTQSWAARAEQLYRWLAAS